MAHANFTLEQLNEMENIVANFFEKNNIALPFPVDSIALAKQIGVKVFATDLKLIGENADALIAVDENKDAILGTDSNKVIFYDRSIVANEDIRFAIAHELAHYITEKEKGRKVVFAEKVKVHGDEKSPEEQRMDYMAAAILVPKKILSSVLNSLNYSKCDDTIKPIITSSLAKTFKVSIPVMARRIEELSEDVG